MSQAFFEKTLVCENVRFPFAVVSGKLCRNRRSKQIALFLLKAFGIFTIGSQGSDILLHFSKPQCIIQIILSYVLKSNRLQMADRSASGLQKPSSRLVKPIGKPLGGSGTAATALSANPLATAAALGANRGAERRDSVSSISSTSVNSTAKKADTATNPSEIQLSVGDVVSIPGGNCLASV